MGAVLWPSLRKARVKIIYRYNCIGLMTQFLQDDRVEEYPTDYKFPPSLRGIDVSQVKKPESAFGLTLIHIERNTCDDSVTNHMFDVQHLTMICGDRRPTEAQLKKLEENFPLSKHPRILCRIGPNFQSLQKLMCLRMMKKGEFIIFQIHSPSMRLMIMSK